jgi:HAD superfamily hydrolase (TIGR01509 family)
VCLQGYRKPAAAAYQAAVSHLQLPPERLIFVDDRQPNVDAAAAAGLTAIKFSGCAKALETELQQLGLEF